MTELCKKSGDPSISIGNGSFIKKLTKISILQGLPPELTRKWKYLAFYFCRKCQVWIPKNDAILNKRGYPTCPKCRRNLRIQPLRACFKKKYRLTASGITIYINDNKHTNNYTNTHTHAKREK